MFGFITCNDIAIYHIAGNFWREIFSEISKMLDTFRKFISEVVYLLATSDYSNSVAPKFYFRNFSFI